MQPNQHIFVYGLLMFPDVVTALTGKSFVMIDATLRDYRRYGLSHSPLDAPVPVLVAETGASQQGKLLLDVDPAAVAILDVFEEIDDGHYVKQQVRVECAGQWYSAFCYAAGPALRPYASGDWQPERVSAEQKAHLVTSVIPALLQTLTGDAQ
jgi:gamma-glutamylcyclotransferase (GGCT)/AIG2-like uncharacterized protein YtfP